MTWTYRKPEPSHIRGICVICNKNQQRRTKPDRYGPICGPCHKRRSDKARISRNKNNNNRTQLRNDERRKNFCEKCGFIAEDKCQLDRDHIDGDHTNDDPSNHMTLCANCHRLKTKLNGETK